jgi:hypothetical protein
MPARDVRLEEMYAYIDACERYLPARDVCISQACISRSTYPNCVPQPRSRPIMSPDTSQSTSFIDLLFRDKLSILHEDLLYPIDFPILIEFDNGFNIGVLLFGLIVRIIRI